jgi:2-polyprenyl-3-methyl-5-hydroxy-6-metoxy-1,4-benzoquinol methylase
MPEGNIAQVSDDASDFYGRNYWFAHQASDLGHPTITERTRTDLQERCTYWVRVLLHHTLPPGRILELGAGHGGFVALLRQAGFDATGQELSPAIVDLARSTFGVAMLQGPVEDQDIPKSSFDVIALFDVMEHLQDPVATLTHCVNLLKPDGFLLIQTPRVPPDAAYEQLLARQDPFLVQFKKEEHLYLFSEQGVRDFFWRRGLPEVAFIPAIYSNYDMFFTASRTALPIHTNSDLAAALSAPSQRLVLALLDLFGQHQQTVRHLAEVELDREARLNAHQQTLRHLAEVELDRDARLNAHQHSRCSRPRAGTPLGALLVMWAPPGPVRTTRLDRARGCV